MTARAKDVLSFTSPGGRSGRHNYAPGRRGEQERAAFDRKGEFPAGWWILPSTAAGLAVWWAVLNALS